MSIKLTRHYALGVVSPLFLPLFVVLHFNVESFAGIDILACVNTTKPVKKTRNIMNDTCLPATFKTAGIIAVGVMQG